MSEKTPEVRGNVASGSEGAVAFVGANFSVTDEVIEIPGAKAARLPQGPAAGDWVLVSAGNLPEGARLDFAPEQEILRLISDPEKRGSWIELSPYQVVVLLMGSMIELDEQSDVVHVGGSKWLQFINVRLRGTNRRFSFVTSRSVPWKQRPAFHDPS